MFNNYKGYFLNVVVPSFLEFAHDSYGSAKFAAMTKGMPLFHNKKGVLPNIRSAFNLFLEHNPSIAEVMKKNRFQVFAPKNICGGTLYPSVDCSDPEMMIAAGLHPPKLDLNPEVFEKTRAEKQELKKLRRVHSSSVLVSRQIPKVVAKGTLFVHEENATKAKDFKTTSVYKEVAKSDVSTILETQHIRENVSYVKFDGAEL